MAKCKDCIHYDVCEALEKGNGIPKVSPIYCGYFKDNADVAEVVRCKDCKYFTIDDGDILGVCDCARIARNNGGEIYPVEEHFCSYGKRKESNDYD